MQYTIKDVTMTEAALGNAVFYCGVRDDVLYRRNFFNYETNTEMHWLDAIDLADLTVPYGIFRADRMRLVRKPSAVTLSSYGFPSENAEIREVRKGNDTAFVISGTDGHGRKISMAMTVFMGFDEMSTVTSKGTNPDRKDSVIIYATAHRNAQYSAKEGHLLLSQVITRADGKDFSEDDLFPVKEIIWANESDRAFEYPTILFKNGRKVRISFDSIESRLTT
jgi:hypothetical protein